MFFAPDFFANDCCSIWSRGMRDDRDRDDADDDYDYDQRRAKRAEVKSNATGLALGISGLVLGVLALLFSFIPCVGVLAFWPGIVASALSVLGLVLSIRSKGLPIAALLVSLASVGIAYWQGERAAKVAGDVKQQIEKNQKNDAPDKWKGR
jgi:hypothetical protein